MVLPGFKDASCVSDGSYILTVKFLWPLPGCHTCLLYALQQHHSEKHAQLQMGIIAEESGWLMPSLCL